MTKGRFVFRLITGGYLAYLGIGLIKDALTEMPENYVWYTVAGAVFAVIGLGWLLTGVRIFLKEGLQEPDADQEDEGQEEAPEEAKGDALPENRGDNMIETVEGGNNMEKAEEEKEEQ
ncbi:hypothetical protein [Dorea sp. D27]|uniref:hypothetical protein n=1 Tax=Dorea sp. D27 TaxID=658665 RepID=UPI000673273B|nr:hypothetical protein [Dorea sp. D27]KMZ55286.1 histone chaperone Cia1 (Anti-silencing function protein 1) [Dorea sp. D27]